MSADDELRRPVGARTRRRRETRRLSRRSFGLTTLAIVPGAGLTRTRYRAFGWVLLAVTIIGLLGVAYLVIGGHLLTTALDVAVQPDMLLALAGTAIVIALVWMFSIILTHRGTEPPQADWISRFGLRFWTAVMCLVVAAPTVQLVRYASIQRDVVGTVFSAGSSSNNEPVVGTATAARPNKTAEDPWKDTPRVNMLLLGSDAGDDREGVRTDSMVVASMDTKTGNTVLISIPRNLQRVPFPVSNPLHDQYPNGYYCPGVTPGNECLINGVWTLAEENKALFKNDKNPGLTTIRGVIGEVTGLTMDYTTVIDLKGFEELVNAMGGVTINVTERLPMNGYHTSSGGIAGVEGWIEPGLQKLSGHQALWYARSRLTTDDFSRMRRQRCLIGTILDQVNPSTMLAKYPQLAQVAKDNITTDVGLKDLPAWVQLVQRIQKGTISSLTFTEDNVNTVRPDFDKIHQMVADSINPPKPAATSTGEATGTRTTTPGPSTTSRPADGNTAVDVKAAC